MKRFLIIVLALFMAAVAFAAPAKLRILAAYNPQMGETTKWEIVGEMLKRDYPGTVLEILVMDLSDGSNLTMAAQLAAGTPPNIYTDTLVRSSQYLRLDYALPLDGLVRDLNKYKPGALDPYRRSGKLLALPQAGNAQGMCINLDIMDEIGYTVPKNWTIDDFLVMAEKVKQKYNGAKWPTAMFAANQSGDYLLNNWYASFGVDWYGKDYDTAHVYDNGGAKVYEWYQKLVKAGYVKPTSATLKDFDEITAWSKGQIAATAFFTNWATMYQANAMKQKFIEKPFAYTFVPFPRAPGVKKVPTYYTNDAIIVKNTGKAIDKIAARMAEYMNGPLMQGFDAVAGTIPTRMDAYYKNTDPHNAEIVAIIADNGIQDVGLSDARFTQRRGLQFPILQKVLNFELSPEEASKQFQAALSAVK
jgi:ABC-type glycerol-3-phosphate transport system substrate-binding protein